MNNQDIKRLEQQSEKDRNDALYWQEKYYEAMKTQDEKTLEAMAGIGADELMPCEICGHKGNPIFHTSSEPHKVWCASCGHKFYGDGHGDLKARWNTRDDIQLPAPYIANKDGTITQQSAVDNEGAIKDLKNALEYFDKPHFEKKIRSALYKLQNLNTNERAKELDNAVSSLKLQLFDATIALKESDEYLQSNKLNQIGSDSILHRQMKQALQQINGGQE